MARRTKKQRGALVSLPARKNSGLGMIMEIKNQKEAQAVYEERKRLDDERGRRASFSEKDKRLSAAFGFYGSTQDGALYPARSYAYIQWIKPPSDWNQTVINLKADWYPLSIIRVISEVANS